MVGLPIHILEESMVDTYPSSSRHVRSSCRRCHMVVEVGGFEFRCYECMPDNKYYTERTIRCR